MTTYPYASTHQASIAVLGIQETCNKWCLFCLSVLWYDLYEGRNNVPMSAEDEKIAASITCLQSTKLVCRDADKSNGMFFHHTARWGLGKFM